MKLIATTFAVSVLALSSISGAKAETFSALLSKSTAAAETSDWRSGASYSRKLLALPDLSSTQSAAAYSHLCMHLTNLAQFDAALVACNRSVALEPTAWGSYVNRGNVYLALGDTAGARANYNRAKAMNPSAPILGKAMAYALPSAYVVKTPTGSQLADSAQ
jgi:Flp pilus assembly protein TadD